MAHPKVVPGDTRSVARISGAQITDSEGVLMVRLGLPSGDLFHVL